MKDTETALLHCLPCFKMFNDILYCLEKIVNCRMVAWLNKPLPLTTFPPHFWATVDKGTPSRTTNQVTLIVARLVRFLLLHRKYTMTFK